MTTQDNVFDLGTLLLRWNDAFFGGTLIGKLFTGNTSMWSRSGTNVFLTTITDRVGIGTDSPHATAKLQIAGGDVLIDNDKQYRSSARASGYGFDGSGTSLNLFANNIITMDIDNNNNSDIKSFTITHDGGGGASELFRVQEDGNVGIGTDSPGEKLHVIGNINVTGNFTGNFIYGETNVHPDGNITVIIETANVHRNITGFDNNQTNGFIMQGDDSLIAQVDGLYEVDYWVSMAGGVNQIYETCIAVNGEHETPHAHRKQGTPGDIGSMSGGGIIDLKAGDIINLQIQNTDSTANADIFQAGMRLVRIGD